jgi:hypothetical protein
MSDVRTEAAAGDTAVAAGVNSPTADTAAERTAAVCNRTVALAGIHAEAHEYRRRQRRGAIHRADHDSPGPGILQRSACCNSHRAA